jgi:hypothetical protein
MKGVDLHQWIVNEPFIKLHYGGILSANHMEQIRIRTMRDTFYIVNTDEQDLPGSHWVVIWIEGGRVELFDSLGNDPVIYGKHFITFMHRSNCQWYDCRMQSEGSMTCGLFCLAYIYMRIMFNMTSETFRHFSRAKYELNVPWVKEFVVNYYGER